jgi:hypothetical protein
MYDIDGELGTYWVVEYEDGDNTDHVSKDTASELIMHLDTGTGGFVWIETLTEARKFISLNHIRLVFETTPEIREQYRIAQALLNKEYKKFRKANFLDEED